MKTHRIPKKDQEYHERRIRKAVERQRKRREQHQRLLDQDKGRIFRIPKGDRSKMYEVQPKCDPDDVITKPPVQRNKPQPIPELPHIDLAEVADEVANLISHGLGDEEILNMLENKDTFEFEFTPVHLVGALRLVMTEGDDS